MRPTTLSLLAAGLMVPALAGAAPPRHGHPASPAVAESYLARYAELQGLRVDPAQVATVKDLTLDRDVGHFSFTDGSLALLTPVGGRVIGAVFHGHGTFSFTPPTQVERDRLRRFEKRDSLVDPFTDVMVLFTDSSLAELQKKLQFGPGSMISAASASIVSMLGFVSDDKSKWFTSDLMDDFLNGTSGGLFYAFINRESGSSLLLIDNPVDQEGVELWGSSSVGLYSHQTNSICQFAAARHVADSLDLSDHGRAAYSSAYKVESWMPQSGGGGMSFSAKAHLDIGSAVPRGPWVAFDLYYKLDVDSARADGGDLLPTYKGHESGTTWIHLPEALEPGKSLGITLYYHGGLLDHYGEFYYIDPNAPWYPRSMEGRSYATFDLTFHSPDWLQLASVGSRVDSSSANRMTTTRWVTDAPIRNASFNLGNFKAYHAQEAGVPPVTVLLSEDAHRTINGGAFHQKNMKEAVGSDVTSALKFFTWAYGPVTAKEFIATEIPYAEGVAFPGLIDLSAWTFQETNRQGLDQVFRAHEVAHQWWGIGVDFTTYHDQWLSEGFAEFSGLWYMQTALKDSKKYFDVLDDWRTSFVTHRDQRTPISLGYRVENVKDELGYQDVVYYKGAWVLHMLRGLMIDLKTMNEDRFTGMMRQFYSENQGKRASTADFQKVVEQASGVKMDWFFNQWVYGYQIPTYKVATRTDNNGGQYVVHLKVTQENVPDTWLMYVPVAVDLGDKKVARFRVKVTGHQSTIDLPALPLQPKSVKFNDLDGVLAEVKTVDW
ncbi:MAG TPA: M1 family aminopeptidase [Gemmatimonadales bacterium]|nr:M1 family aminopeptidase [Gemmatimonadales bacterium]